jgi:SAM-dependent methyltransferase
MADYREKIYASYRSTIYGLSNPDSLAQPIEGYRTGFGEFLPGNKEAKILDLGCGSGYLVNFLIQSGYQNVLGIDNSIEQVEFASKKGLPVIQANALDFLKENRDFDLIILTDVIEHLKKDEIIDLLESILSALAVGGSVIIRTGNASAIYGTTMRYIDFTHELEFTETSMRQVLLACGFTKISISDNKPSFGWKPKRLLRWILFKIWRAIFRLIYLIEVGEDSPRLLGKLLIAQAYKASTEER